MRRGLSLEEIDKLEPELEEELKGYEEWLTSIEDVEMLKKAKKMDISLDDFPCPDADPNALYPIENSHYCYGNLEGGHMLRTESQHMLRKLMRERAPSYRKERRELWELWLKAGTLIMGIIGVATGFVAVLKK